MTRIDTVTTADLDDLVTSVAGLFAEDGGRFDSTMDTSWPARGGAAYYGGLVDDDACLLTLARERERTLGHLGPARGAERASVTAFAGNEAAQRFYARHGFTPMSVTLRTTL